MLPMKEFNVDCNLIGVIPVSQRFVVFPDAQINRPVLSQASIKINVSHVKKFDQSSSISPQKALEVCNLENLIQLSCNK